ncbi:MAG TPA: hypothetical protein VL098_08830 [Flavipsychrobacter sp.]|nr:hypothetical protein [Flavipsychrobacter sp.]
MSSPSFLDSVSMLIAPFPESTYAVVFTDSVIAYDNPIISCDEEDIFERNGYKCQSQK